MSAPGEEQLRLVTDFGELREGVTVVVTRCGHCAGRHRGMLIKRHSGVLACDSGVWETGPLFHERPKVGVCAHFVEDRIVFRVLDGLDAKRDARELAELERAAILRTWEPVSAGYARESKS